MCLLAIYVFFGEMSIHVFFQIFKILLFLWLSNIPVCVGVRVCVCVYLFIQKSISGPLSWFHNLAILNIAVLNIGMHIAVQISVFMTFESIPSSVIIGS